MENVMRLPKFMKDELGFCYVATEHLLTVPRLTPYDGDIDGRGYAVDTVVKPAADKVKKPAKTVE